MQTVVVPSMHLDFGITTSGTHGAGAHGTGAYGTGAYGTAAGWQSTCGAGTTACTWHEHGLLGE